MTRLPLIGSSLCVPPRAGFSAIALAAALCALPALAVPDADSNVARPTQDSGYALVQLDAEPLSTHSRSKPVKGKKIDFSSATVKAYRALLSKLRNDYKAWLRANVPQASISGEFDISLNAVAVKLNGATLAQVSATAMVRTAQYQGLYYPNPVVPPGVTIDDPDLALIQAEQAWAASSPPNAGEGVKVAVIDTGIDHTHPCFTDVGYDPVAKSGDPALTNNKVIVAKVFNNKLNQNGFSAEAIQDHGTHVAGTVGCNYQTPATVNGVTIPYGISGVAPRALLGNYNVFPGTVVSARSEDILNALDAAYADGFDVANMSLGGGSNGKQDLLTVAVDNLDKANMVIAVSAGNSGPGKFTVGSPGIAARALTGGASTVPHFVGAPVSVGGSTYGAASGEFAVVGADTTATLSVVTGSVGGLGTACTALPAGSLVGEIALLSRGTCTFSVKIRNAQTAGATAVLVANNVAGDPTAMASDGTPNQPTIPAYMVGRDDGQALKGKGGQATTIGVSLSYFLTANANIMAGFSSQGPTDVDFRVKPDVVAPGVNVLSSVPRSATCPAPCFAFFSGTSMASPHLAGSAAVIRGQHPTWSAAEVRSAVVNTAKRDVLKDFQSGTALVSDVNIVGAGLENLLNAVDATVALDPVSLSFGALASGGGQSLTLPIRLTNTSGASKTYSVAVVEDAADGAAFSVSGGAGLTLGDGASATVNVTVNVSRGASVGLVASHKQAVLRVSVGATAVANAMLYTFVK